MQKNAQKKHTFREEFPYICVLAVLAALVGWLGENISKLIASGKIDSRFHLLPFLSPYGLIVLFIYAALRDVDRATFFGKPLFQGNTLQTKSSPTYIACCLSPPPLFWASCSLAIFGNRHSALFFGITPTTPTVLPVILACSPPFFTAWAAIFSSAWAFHRCFG